MSSISSSLNGSSNGSSITGKPDAYSSLTSNDFVKIMFTELSNQDPLKPNDSNALLQQMSSLRNIQSSIDLSNKLTSVVTQNQLATAGAMLGKTVSGLTPDGLSVSGVVKSVSNTSDGPVLNLTTGERVPYAYIDQLRETAATTTPAATTTATP